MNERFNLRVLNAKAHIRAWSRQRTLAAIAAAALAVLMSSPLAAQALDTTSSLSTTQNGVATQQVANPHAKADAKADASGKKQLADKTTKAEQAAAQAVAKAIGHVSASATTKPQNPPVATTTDKKADESKPADPKPADESKPADTKPADESKPADTKPADETKPADTKPGETPTATDKTDASKPAETPKETPKAPDGDTSSTKPVATPTVKPTDKATEANTNSYGTKIIFDFNGDGKTDANDWKEYLKWMHNYKPFDFDLKTGELGTSHNGGLQITGATELLVNGKQRRLDSIDTNLDITKITQYYLNNIGQITPVKDQDPHGTCWAFASISALESAILKAQDAQQDPKFAMAYSPRVHLHPVLNNLQDHGVDLSELYLAWMAYDLQQAGSQKGEGQIDVLPPDSTPDRLECGGWATMAQTLFGSWKALTTEKAQPYWPKGIPMTFENLRKMSKWHDYWALHTDKDGKVREQDAGARVNGVYYLPNPNIIVPDRNDHLVWKGYNDYANKLIKQALVKHGAVQIGYSADSFYPGQASKPDYFNGKYWAQYCDATNLTIDHAVTIVGWDDNFDPAKFQAGKNNVKGLKKGAWLVKNSWSCYDFLTKRFKDVPEKLAARMTNWGIVDENGHHTGFFWLSYYDHSINTPSYFSVDLKSDGYDYDNNYSYDFLINQSQSPFVLRTADKGTVVSNIFTAKGDECLRAVSVQTQESHSKATIRVYLLKSTDALKDNDPTNDGDAVITMNYEADVPGLHTVKLPHPVNLHKGQIFAIVQNVTGINDDGTTNSYLNLETGMSQAAQWPDKNNAETKGRAMGYAWTYVVANPGETYIKLLTKDGYKWVTPQEIGTLLGNKQYFEFGNALIKAFTTNGLAKDIAYNMIKVPAVTQGKPAEFVSEAPLRDATKVQVKIDEKLVDSANFSVTAGSTKVTLADSFTKLLALGKHAIEIISEDGSAKASFVVNKAVAPVVNESNVNGANTTTTGNVTGTVVQTSAASSKVGVAATSVGTTSAPAAAVVATTAKLPQTGDASGVASMLSTLGGSILAGFGMLLRRKKH